MRALLLTSAAQVNADRKRGRTQGDTMIERPILFSGPLVRAILDWRKTQTRRLVRAPLWWEGHRHWFTGNVDPATGVTRPHQGLCDPEGGHYYRGPYGSPGDRLWVCESLYFSDEHDNAYYSADKRGVGDEVYARLAEIRNGRKAVPSIHMPRWASRLTLEVTSIRVERLQDITEEDAVAEGATAFDLPPELHASRGRVGWTLFPEHVGQPDHALTSARWAFGNAWNRVHGGPRWNCTGAPEPWALNPWVWVVSFRRVEA